jgi:ribose transport system permease protein
VTALPARAAPARQPLPAAVSWLLASPEIGLLAVLTRFCLGFGLASRGFLSPFNLFALSRVAAVDVMLGLAMMTVIVTGGLDLSVGAIGVASSMVAGWTMQVAHLPVPAGVLAALIAGGLLGLLNGGLIVRSGMHSFVVTLATTSLIFGAMIILTRAEAFRDLPESFAALARLRWFREFSPLLLCSVLLGVLLHYLYRFTDTGRRLLAAGANPRAAALSGIDVGRVIMQSHMLAGLLAACAGLMVTMRNGASIPSMAGNLGQDWLLPAFLAPVLGGTLLTGGHVSVPGTVLGALLLAVLDNGLLQLHVGAFWVQFFLGMLLLAAVLIEKGRIRMLRRTGAMG